MTDPTPRAAVDEKALLSAEDYAVAVGIVRAGTYPDAPETERLAARYATQQLRAHDAAQRATIARLLREAGEDRELLRGAGVLLRCVEGECGVAEKDTDPRMDYIEPQIPRCDLADIRALLPRLSARLGRPA